MVSNGRGPGDNREDLEEVDEEDFEPAEYALMMELEELESLEEEMEELGVRTLEEVRQRIAALHQRLDHGK